MCVAQPAGSRGTPQVFSTAGASKLKALITPFNDPQANKKMLSLATAQMLCSVATLIHDTYLPVYMSDVLGMSNSKIGNLQAIALFLSKVRWTAPLLPLRPSLGADRILFLAFSSLVLLF